MKKKSKEVWLSSFAEQGFAKPPRKTMKAVKIILEVVGGVVILIITGTALFGLITYVLMWKMSL